MAFVDATVVNVALPALQHALNASAFDAQWVIEAYSLFLASLLLIGGALGDRFGRRRIFMMGAGLFTCASLACALCPTIGLLIAARAVQGVGAALLVPGSLALISATYPERHRGQAIGTWSAWSGITGAIGPVLGGFLVDHFSWTWAFLMNVPIGALLLFICATRVPESRLLASDKPIDAAGSILVTVGLAGIVFAFIEAPRRGWIDKSVLAAAVVGLLGLGLFLTVQARRREPMLPLALFRINNFAGANLLTLLLYAALTGGMYFFPLNLIKVQGFSATAAGAAMLPFIAIMFVLSTWAGRLVDRFGPKRPLTIGPVIAALGFASLAAPGLGASWFSYFPAICLLGFGMSITVAPLTTTVMNSLDSEQAGVASGVNNAISRAAGLLAIAIFSVVLIRGLDLAGFRYVMLACAGLAVSSALCAWWLIDGKPRSTTGTTTKHPIPK
jgi:EmrB/QacA subfamily drug resistance transporter